MPERSGDIRRPPVSKSDETEELVLTAMLAEYDSLRSESLASIEHRISIMNFTFGAISILLAALLASPLPAAVVAAVSLVALPQIAKAALLIWLGEYARSQRAGRGIAKLEERINALLGSAAMTWESSLQSRSTHMGYPYVATVFLMLGSGYAAELVGIWYMFDALASWAEARSIVVVAIGLVILVLESAFLRFFLSRWTKSRSG